jgi:hypothetical protein
MESGAGPKALFIPLGGPRPMTPPVEMTILLEGELRISMRVPRNCRSLGFARDDKGKRSGSIESGCQTEVFFSTSGGPQVEMTILLQRRLRLSPGNGESYPQTKLSSRPERTRISCLAALDTVACAPFFKERRMMFASATNFYRKSGVAQCRDLRFSLISHTPS